jgi:hypothetical protein
MVTLALVHRTTRERRVVEIVRASHQTIDVKWPLCGVYRFCLKRCALIKIPEWEAEDKRAAQAAYFKFLQT